MIKNILKILVLLLNFSISFSQIDLTKSIDKDELGAFWKADSLFNQKEYHKAMEFYKKCNPENNFDLGWPIKKSLCYLLVNDTIAAKKEFSKYTYDGGHYMYSEWIGQIPSFEILAADKKIETKFRKNTYAFENSDSTCLYPDVLKTLMEMRTIDQAYRNGDQDPNVSLTTIDSLNRIKLDSLINMYGWLGYKEVGKSGENAAFLIVQHSDRDVFFQKKCVKLMQNHLFEGNIWPQSFALLYDRIKVNSNEPQLFGSQVEIDRATNKFVPKKVYSLQLLNAYRLYMGLGTIESYLEIMNKRKNLN
jgi:hypothetical protein